LFIEIAIANQGAIPVGFPLAFRQKSGPAIRLIDNRTKAESTLPTNPVDLNLANEFTAIPPGQSVMLEWVIKPSEIQPFATPEVNVSAEITVFCNIQVNRKIEEFRGTDTLLITGTKTR
jgi:hypothetical protein